MPSGRIALAALAAATLALAGPAPARAGGRPDGKSLWRAYPLDPTVTATASGERPDFGHSVRDIAERPAAGSAGHAKPTGGGGAPLLPIGLAGLALAAAAAF